MSTPEKEIKIKKKICIKRDFLKHKTVKTNVKIKENIKKDCLVYEMLFIRSLKPNLNVQADSIRAKVFL